MDPEPESLLEHAGWIRRLAHRLVADPELADDLVQETWVAALRNPPRKLEATRAFLARTLRNSLRQNARAERHRETRERANARGEADASAAELIAEVDSQRVVVEEVLGLSEPYRTTVLLRFFRDLSAADIARREGLPPATVRSRLKRGLDELRERLDARHGGDRSAWSLGILAWAHAQPAPPPATPPPSLGIPPSLAALEGIVAMKAIKVLSVLGVAALAAVGISKLDSEPAEAARAVEPARLAQSDGSPQREQVAQPATVPSEREGALATPEPEAAPAPEPETLAAPRSSTHVVATFVDDAGAAIPGVRFRLTNTNQTPPIEVAPSFSDGAGTARLELPLDTDAFAYFDWSADGYVADSSSAEIRRGERKDFGTIRLVSGSAVLGRVIDESGRPVAGARVWALDVEIPAGDKGQLERKGPASLRTFSSIDNTPKVHSDDGGAFRIPGVAFGPARVWAHADGTEYCHSEPIEVPMNGDLHDVEIVLRALEPNATIEGVVLSADGDPVPHEQVKYTLHDDGFGMSNQLTTNAEGAFRLVVWRPAPHTFSVRDDESGQTARAGDVPPGTHDLVLQLGDTLECELVVTDTEGQPIESYRVDVCVGDSSSYTSDRLPTVQDAQGRSAFTPPGSSFWLQVESTGYALGKLGPFEPAEVPAELTLTLETAPSIAGRVFADGEPVAGVTVQLYRFVPADRRFFANGYPAHLRRAFRDVQTDADGRFVITPPSEGDYVLRAELSGWADTESARVHHTSTGVSGVDIHMVEPGTLIVDVIAPSGDDAAGLIVAGNRGDGHPLTVRTDSGRRAVFENITPGRWNVTQAESELHPSSSTASSMAFNGEEEPFVTPWVVEVFPGEVAHYTLVLEEDDD